MPLNRDAKDLRCAGERECGDHVSILYHSHGFDGCQELGFRSLLDGRWALGGSGEFTSQVRFRALY